jgi:hypothetical protein
MSEREMRDLIELLERQLGATWVEIVEWIRESNPVAAIELRLIERGVAGGLIQEVTAAAERFAVELHAAYVQAGQKSAAWLNGKVPDSLIRFDQMNARAVSRAQANRYELVREITEEQRAVVRRVVADGMRTGANPRVRARDLHDSIGLTEKQSVFVRNYRSALEDGDWSNALGRELRDGRSDKLIRRLRRDNGTLAPAQVDSMVERYRKNWIGFRAETIARTEALRAAHEGHDEAMRQAIERGDLEAGELVETWHSRRRGPRARDQHQAMDERSVPFGTDFVLPDGTRMRGPGDPRGGAKHNANCGCAKSTSYTAESAEKWRDMPSVKPAPVPLEAQKKNPKRVESARKAAAASVERRREIHSAAKTNLPDELQAAWDKEGHKFMREEAARIRGVKVAINAGSKRSEAFAEKYGSGFDNIHGNEGDRFYRRAEIEANHAEERFKREQAKHYEEQRLAASEDDDYARRLRAENDAWLNPPAPVDDDEPPF